MGSCVRTLIALTVFQIQLADSIWSAQSSWLDTERGQRYPRSIEFSALDVEWAHAIAPGATIIVSVAKSASFSDLLGAVDAVQAGATVISMSWGGQESTGINFFDSHFQTTGRTPSLSTSIVQKVASEGVGIFAEDLQPETRFSDAQSG
jgi:subtilase family serine protease